MNEILQNMLTRRSVRDFSDKPIAKADIETLLEAAIYAPSGMNKQSWQFVAVLNQDRIQALAAAVGKAWDREGYDFYKPVALIITSNEADSKWGRSDNACAMQNIALAAHSMGIGSVWINQLFGFCDVPEIRAILTELGVPENHIVHGVAALGYSKSAPKGQVSKEQQYRIVE